MIDRINQDLKTAMRARDKERLLVLRSLKADLLNREVELRENHSKEEASELLKSETIDVLQKAVKSREQSLELFKQGEREDLVRQTASEIAIIREYLPSQMSEEEISGIVAEVCDSLEATGMKDMGRVMKAVMAQVGARADGKVVSAIVRQRLGSGA